MKTETTYITCDECAALDASELRFAVNGRNYAIDLCVTHRAIFDTLIQTYITNGHPVRFNGHSIRKDGKRNALTAKPDPEPPDAIEKPKRHRKSRAKASEAPTIEPIDQTNYDERDEQ